MKAKFKRINWCLVCIFLLLLVNVSFSMTDEEIKKPFETLINWAFIIGNGVLTIACIANIVKIQDEDTQKRGIKGVVVVVILFAALNGVLGFVKALSGKDTPVMVPSTTTTK